MLLVCKQLLTCTYNSRVRSQQVKICSLRLCMMLNAQQQNVCEQSKQAGLVCTHSEAIRLYAMKGTGFRAPVTP